MVKAVTMYTVICDNCGKDSNDGNEYSCYSDESQAEEMAMNSDWITEGDKHYCTNCASYDDDDKLVLREIKKRGIV